MFIVNKLSDQQMKNKIYIYKYKPRGEPDNGIPGCERIRSNTGPRSNSKSSGGTLSQNESKLSRKLATLSV